MKCPKCSAESTVDATRPYLVVFTQRFRRCMDNHRFVTFEVYAGNLDKRTLGEKLKGVIARRAAATRRRTILARPDLSAGELAKTLDITEARVRQVRAAGPQ